MKADLACLFAACVGCGYALDARYAPREPGCAVEKFPGAPKSEVDDLGIVSVDCRSESSCDRQLLDGVCARGGDVAWGLADNALTASHRVAHAAHTRRSAQSPRERGCPVQVFDEAPPMPTENIGPVSALCAEDDSHETCLRELEDQVCLLGGNVLWEVEGRLVEGNKHHLRGRGAHTK
ncbi:MAG: hypothetical protein ABSF69_12705 [Polyangiaceae bacterium]|jgi:hypothetical protein